MTMSRYEQLSNLTQTLCMHQVSAQLTAMLHERDITAPSNKCVKAQATLAQTMYHHKGSAWLSLTQLRAMYEHESHWSLQ